MHKVNTSLQRILWLIYVEIRYKLPSIGLMFLVCFAILMVYYWNPSFKVTQLINEFNNNSFASTTTINGITYPGNTPSYAPDLKYHIEYFSLAFIVLGVAIISVLFSEYGSVKSRVFNISLPASPSQKWMAKVIIALVVYPVTFLLTYQLYAQVTYHWGAMRGYDFVRLGLLDPLVWRHVMRYLLIGSIVIGLATYFRKLGVVKTGLFGILGYFMLTIVLSIMAIVVFPEFDTTKMGSFFSLDGYKNYVFGNSYQFTAEFVDFADILFSPLIWSLLAIVSLVLSYYKFYELEA